MASIQTLQEFVQAELAQKENLFTVLGTFKGSKSPDTKTNIAAIVRGLCTNNQKILRLAQQCLEEMQQDSDIESLKNFANDMVLWFDQNFVVFEKFLLCLSTEQFTADTTCENALLHCECYIRLIDSITARIRNPFVVSKLCEAKARVEKLLSDFHAARSQSDLDNITFDHVRSLSGHNVSCFFTVDQIVHRTANAVLNMGKRRVELLLLNLDRSPEGQPQEFNSLAILELSSSAQPRSVVYPPFRVNELSMAHSSSQITFSAFDADVNKSFVISGDKKLLKKWFRSLTKIFPTSDVPLTSSSISLHGLGINTHQIEDDSGCSSPNASLGSDEPLTTFNSDSSLQIMKKSLSNDGIEPELKHQQQLKVIQVSNGRESITTKYDYVKDVEPKRDELKKENKVQDLEKETVSDNKQRVSKQVSEKQPVSEDSRKNSEKKKEEELKKKKNVLNSPCDSIDCFDIITTLPDKKTETKPNQISQNKAATVSMPDLSAAQPPTSIYINATGSAIDVNQFGKDYNPTFACEQPKQRRKSLFSLFKKKRGTNENVQTTKAEDEEKSVEKDKVLQKKQSKETLNKEPSTQKLRYRPDLQIEIPKIGAFDANMSQPSSAASTSNRTLPSPFAMPSSTSTYFFKPYVNNSSSTLPQAAAAAAAAEETEDKEEISLSIPRELKDMINSERTLDYYMSPVSSTSLKVSKWKSACAKWELMTTNENVFVKIASHDTTRNWLLIFKEEHDEEYDEVVDKPLLILELDDSTKARQSSALDIEINAENAITHQRNVIMIRCSSSNLAKDISGSLTDVMELKGQNALTQTSHFESNMTLTSSLMSKPSASSTVSSIYTQLDSTTHGKEQSNSDKLLLDRMTVRVHKQKESYEHIHMPSSWETMSMYSLSISHSMGQDKGIYHFDLESKTDDDASNFSWTFHDDMLLSQIERIGKAGMLVRVSESDMYMLECKGRKEFQRLIDLF